MGNEDRRFTGIDIALPNLLGASYRKSIQLALISIILAVIGLHEQALET
ncbi:hypothetical protein SAMN05216428_11539 [Nitrosospira sp. Nsp11]|nr:hypothetical protein SAMN05216428_11539 [Nitrosospira sp. Nsp11]